MEANKTVEDKSLKKPKPKKQQHLRWYTSTEDEIQYRDKIIGGFGKRIESVH
jgi:hypothetical protein